MKKHAILGIAAASLVLAGCGTSPEGKAEYLDWIEDYRPLMPELSDDEVVSIGEDIMCPAGEAAPSANGMFPAVIEVAEDVGSEAASAMKFAAITHLCPEVGAKYTDPIPDHGGF